MKLYLDVIFFLNFAFDFLLLVVVSIVLKRNIGYKRILLGSFLGGMSIFFLFIKLSSFQLFFGKFLISIVMTIVTFSFKDLKYTLKNMGVLYMVSMVLGGFLYFLNCEFAYKQEGLIFYHAGMSINFWILIIFSPIILYIYIRQAAAYKNHYASCYKVNIYLKNHETIKMNGFLDTGNHLKDPYCKRPIVITDQRKISEERLDNYILVPFTTIASEEYLRCIEIDKLEIEGVGEVKNVLLGITKRPIRMDGIDCIFGTKVLEG